MQYANTPHTVFLVTSPPSFIDELTDWTGLDWTEQILREKRYMHSCLANMPRHDVARR